MTTAKPSIGKLAEDFTQFEKSLEKLTAENTALTGNVAKLKDQVNREHVPIDLEKDVLKTVQQSVAECIGKVLMGYNSPLVKLVERVIDDHSAELKGIITDSFQRVIRTEDFKSSILEALAHKVSRTIISGQDAVVGKIWEQLKQDAIFKAKVTTMIAGLVEESLKK
jgi:hypothetical protein